MENSTFNHRFYCLTDKQLVDYKKGDVSSAERVWAAQHLSKCEECSKTLEQLKVVRENQQGYLKTIVKGRILHSKSESIQGSFLKKLDPRITLAMGTLALIVLGIFFYNKFFIKIESQPLLQAAASPARLNNSAINQAAFRDINQPQAFAVVTVDSTAIVEVVSQPVASAPIAQSQVSSIKPETTEQGNNSSQVLSAQAEPAPPINNKEVIQKEAIKGENIINTSTNEKANKVAVEENVLEDKQDLKNARKEAKVALNKGDVSKAEENYYNIAQTHLKNNNPAEAKKYLNKVIELDGTYKSQAEKEMQNIE